MIISGKYIRELREGMGLTQEEVATRVGITQAHVAKIETGKVDARLSTINKILSVLKSDKNKIKCKDVLIKHIIFVTPEDRVERAIHLMKKYGISQIPVIEDKASVGSIKDSTIIGNLEQDLAKKRVGDIMEKSFPVVDSEDDVDIAKFLLGFHQAVLVSDKGNIIGIITKSDLLKSIK